ncbi:MAG: hypothetical protein H6Q75_1342 [Firmicutes bacterium]|nr:hypothetical protein [Bacillota bacterium]
MLSIRVTIDQTPCRASYGLLTPSARLDQDVADQKEAVRENIAAICARGDRLAKIWNKGNTVEELAAEAYAYQPKEVQVKYIERPVIRCEPSSNFVNIFV